MEQSNGFNRELSEELLRRIDDADLELADLASDYKAACKDPRGRIAAALEEAKDKGLPGKAFKALVKNRRLDRKMHANVERLEGDEQADYDALVSGLGDFIDLPLGQAAERRARPAETHDSVAAS